MIEPRIHIVGKEYFARGKRGIAYTALLGAKKVLVKEFNPRSDVNTIEHEARMLKLVNTIRVGPRFIALKDGALIRDFIDGPEFMDWVPMVDKERVKRAMLSILEQCRRMDSLGVNKLEMNHPHKHLLMRRGTPVMIDFDRSRIAARPKNVTQVCQWFTSGTLSPLLRDKGIIIDKQSFLELARAYKAGYGEREFKMLAQVISDA